jgi:hypothetical protein
MDQNFDKIADFCYKMTVNFLKPIKLELQTSHQIPDPLPQDNDPLRLQNCSAVPRLEAEELSLRELYHQ